MAKLIRCVVVDDSALSRKIVRAALESVADIEVVAIARDGIDAIERCQQLKPDFVTMDLEMPRMDGIEAVRQLRKVCPSCRVVMVSSQTSSGAESTTRALSAGALDFILKPVSSNVDESVRLIATQLAEKIEIVREQLSTTLQINAPGFAAGSRSDTKLGTGSGNTGNPFGNTSSPRSNGQGNSTQSNSTQGNSTLGSSGVGSSTAGSSANASPTASTASVPTTSNRPLPTNVQAICIGVSTGGPVALTEVMSKMPARLGVPVFIVQHMPPIFTRSLAEQLDRISPLTICEASDGMKAVADHVYIAPGGMHMRLEGAPVSATIRITTDPPVSNARPSVDYLFSSAAKLYRSQLVAAVLTGMGNDGLAGCREIRQQGGYILTQDAKTSVVYGMPRCVAEHGLSDQVYPISGIAPALTRISLKGALQCN